MVEKLAGIAMGLALVTGCAATDDGAVPETSQAFTVHQHDDRTLEASVADGDASLSVLVVETSDNVVDITFDFGDPIIAFTLDYNQGVGDFMPTGAALDAAQSRLLDRWLEGVSEVVNHDDASQSRVEFASVRVGGIVQIIPVGESLVAGQFQSLRGWRHISTTCKRQYIGGGYYRTCGKGCGCNGSGRGCAGRCGKGCGGTSSPKCRGSTAYTRDCARHDYGVGSWWSASDDFSFASNNASCGGNCY